MQAVEMPCLISLGQIAFTRDALHAARAQQASDFGRVGRFRFEGAASAA